MRLLELIWGRQQGHVSVPVARGDQWYERWYEWPQDRELIKAWIETCNEEACVYFSPLVYPQESRRTASGCISRWAWADFDEVNPKKLDPKPTILWETSPGRYQGLYALKRPIRADEIEKINRRIAIATKADPSGWDAGQVLRIPGSKNHKYDGSPKGKFVYVKGPVYDSSDFAHISLPKEAEIEELKELPFRKTLETWRSILPAHAIELLEAEEAAKGERSNKLWLLIRYLVEASCPQSVVYTLAKGSVWNKFAGRSDEEERLKKEIAKAIESTPPAADDLVVLEREMPDPKPKTKDGFRFDTGDDWLSRYVRASERYVPNVPHTWHVACGLSLLSLAVGRYVTLSDIQPGVFPNLYVLIVGPSRAGKGRSFNFAFKTFQAFQAAGYSDEVPFGTDFTPEGLTDELGSSPVNQLWLVTEEAGALFRGMRRRDYMSGSIGMMNMLYDGRPLRRTQKRKKIHIPKPCLTFHGMTTPEDFRLSLTQSEVATGFLARFMLFYEEHKSPVSVTRIPMGREETARELGQELAALRDKLKKGAQSHTLILSNNRKAVYNPLTPQIEADLTGGAFRIFKELVEKMDERSEKMADIGPVFAEAGPHALKVAMLMSLANNPEILLSGVTISEDEMYRAAKLVEAEMVKSEGLYDVLGGDEWHQLVKDVYEFIREQGGRGASRTDVQRKFGRRIGTKRKMDDLEQTMEDRGLIKVKYHAKRTNTRPRKMYYAIQQY